jgi:hypothetical protein
VLLKLASNSEQGEEMDMKRVLLICTVLFLFLSAGYILAQEGMTKMPARVVYLVGNVDVDSTPDNNIDDFQVAVLEMTLPAGSMVRTGRDGYCELQLHDGSTIKVSHTSVFKIEDISYNKDSGRKRSKFNLLFGKMKAKVSKLTTTDSEFDVRSGTTLAGVRGTTFGLSFDGVESQVLVFEGLVEVESVTRSFEPHRIRKGRVTTVQSDGLLESPTKIPEDIYEEWEEEFSVFTEVPAEAVLLPDDEEKREGVFSIGATFGSLTIDSTYYNRWALLTDYEKGRFSFGLYLPVIYLPGNGFFNVDDWYNHDEWDFTDLNDAFHDLLLKIGYLQYGDSDDVFFFRLGGLEKVSLFQGFIVSDYTNMLFFPQEVSTGVTLNVGGYIAGIDSFVAHVDGTLQTSALRGYVRPFGKRFPLHLGGSVFYDWPKPDSVSWPVGPLGQPTENEDQLPRILIVGLDTGFPVVDRESFSMELHLDAAKIGYQYNQLHPALSGAGVEAGKVEFLKGFGTAAGLGGSVGGRFDYRADYRYISDYYEPGIINYNWDNRRLTYQQELLDVVVAQNDMSYVSEQNHGLYLSAGIRFFDMKLATGISYGSYNRYTGSATDNVEEGQIYLRLEEGLVPNTWGQFSYDRGNNVSTIFEEPFDESTLLNLDLFYRVAPSLTMSLAYKRTFRYDDAGLQWIPIDSFGINTMVRF